MNVDRAQIIFFLILFFLLLGPNGGNDLSNENRNKVISFKQFKEDIQHSNEVLRNSTWEEGYGNLAGFSLSYQDALDGLNQSTPINNSFTEDQKYSILPNEISELAMDIWSTEEGTKKIRSGSFPLNVSGTLRGQFHNSNKSFTRIPMVLPPFYNYSHPLQVMVQPPTEFDDPTPTPIEEKEADINGNITDFEGDLMIRIGSLEEYTSINEYCKDTTVMSLEVEANDFDELHQHKLNLIGLYHQNSGNLVATTRTGKFDGVHALPHLTLYQELFNQSKSAMIQRTNRTHLEDLEISTMDYFRETSDNCEHVMYLHFESTGLSKDELRQIDDELFTPIGRPHKKIPPVKITSGLLYSPDCGISINFDEIVGPRKEVQEQRLRNVILSGIVILFVQIFFSVQQMSATTTPSTISRISFSTLAILNLIDGSLSILYALCSVVYERLYLPITVSAFLSFTLASVFEMRYMISIYLSQMNERNVSMRTALQGTPIDNINETQPLVDNNETILPTTQAPTTTTPQQQNIRPTILEDEQTVSGQIYTRFFFFLIAFTFLILNAILWPRKSRLIFEYITVFALSSFWVPQVYRNVYRGTRKSFNWGFVIGTSILRVLPVGYVCLYKHNVFYHHYDPIFFIVIISWLGLQILVLQLQEFLGPRFFVPDKMLPAAYDYHPVLTESDLENGFGASEDEGHHVTHEDGHCVVDCAICMSELKVPVVSRKGLGNEESTEHSNIPGILSRRVYMVTPCRHLFHSECLESWMQYKLQCPVCRNPLPPL
ncbi:BA75_00049T0 [Komagataella pastoris]|uniref:RING-type E3 ubiquitin transferase n=1 Tax=Komagataella pastoris TaxID=4922 RepID=A0A1B2J5T0_PICPA|nr:BA75_00049T0 [Komagataella pastoris]